jgi:hypothetical protein
VGGELSQRIPPHTTMPLIFTCKQASKSLAERDYASLPWHAKLSLKLHVATCLVCGKYNRQVMVMQDAVRTFRKRKDAEIETDRPGAPCLSACCKDKLKAALAEAAKTDPAAKP